MHQQRFRHRITDPHLRVQGTDRVLENKLQVAAHDERATLHFVVERRARIDGTAGGDRHQAEYAPHEARFARA